MIEAMDAVQAIARQDRVALFALCSGGMLASMVLGHLAAIGDLDRVAAFSLAVTVIDQARAGMPSALVSRKVAAAATKVSQEKGYLDGRMLAEVFAWLRPNDLVWNYWVNNYLLGKTPKAFDILFWNADSVRMTAAMHRDFMQIAVENSLTRPGGTRMLGSDVDLGAIDIDSYLVAGIADHLCDWKACYRTTQLLGGELALRALDQRPHRLDGQPARQPQGQLPDRRRTTPSDSGDFLEAGRDRQGHLVDRLRRVARRRAPVRSATSRAARLRGVPGRLRRSRHLRP